MRIAISPCPNDTFAFHHLVASGDFDVTLHDVEALNEMAERGEAEVTKISVAAFGRLRDRYALLRSGGAAGFGVGPLVVARTAREIGGRVAIPGERTTAALLLRLLGRFDTVPMRFDLIEQAVASGDVDCGVLIHEGRFTHAKKGLTKLHDLGEIWEKRMSLPVPLGAIAIRRDLGGSVAVEIDARIRKSVEHALAHPEESADYVAEHAQELAPDVIAGHIDLYVNDYTLALDEDAVTELLAFGEGAGLFPPSDRPTFAYVPLT